MKKLTSAIAVITAALLLAACGKKQETAAPAEPEVAPRAVPEAAPEAGSDDGTQSGGDKV